MKKSTLLLVIGGLILFGIGGLAWMAVAPAGPVVISRETTFLTEPLRPDGLVDYEQALVDMQGNDVVPENNAAIPLLQAMWPCELLPAEQPLICTALRMPVPTSPGMEPINRKENLAAIAAWLNQQRNVQAGDDESPPTDNSAAQATLDRAGSAPWTRPQLPPLADWLDQQTVHFDKLHEINQRTQYFLPSPTLLQQKQDYLLGLRLEMIQSQREASRALSARAMLRIGEGKPRAAWEDIQTSFAISRGHADPGFLVELLVSIAIRGQACDRLIVLLNSGQCDDRLLQEIEQFLVQLPPLDLTPSLNVAERLMCLDAALIISGDSAQADSFADDLSDSGLLRMPYDRNAMLRYLNGWYDRMTAAYEIEDLAQRRKTLSKLTDDMDAMLTSSRSAENLAGAIFNQSTRGEIVAQTCLALFLPALPQMNDAQERANLQVQLLQVATALERWKLAQGDYPVALDQLADRIGPALLQDPYSPGSAMFRYERRPPGYLLYSLFLNNRDDGGDSTFGDIVDGEWLDQPGRQSLDDTDWVLRLPLPQRPFVALPTGAVDGE